MAWEMPSMALTENYLVHIVPDEAIPEMVEMSACRLAFILQDLRKSLHEAGVMAKLDFPRMVENLAGEDVEGDWRTENWASTCESAGWMKLAGCLSCMGGERRYGEVLAA
jgi:hypothetical protein